MRISSSSPGHKISRPGSFLVQAGILELEILDLSHSTVICLEVLGPSELFVQIIFARPSENLKICTPPSGFGPPLVDSVCGRPLAGFPGQPHCSSAKHEEGDTKPLETVPPLVVPDPP